MSTVELFLLCMAVSAWLTGKYSKDTAVAAYGAGKEPPGVTKARMRHEAGGGKTSPKTGGPRGKGALRLWAASRWARTWDGIREEGERKTARKREWLDTEGRKHKDDKWLERKRASLDRRAERRAAAHDNWDLRRKLVDLDELRKRNDEAAAHAEHEWRQAEMDAYAEQQRRNEAKSEPTAEPTVKPTAEPTVKPTPRAEAERGSHTLTLEEMTKSTWRTDPDRPFRRRTDWALNDFATAPVGALTPEARQAVMDEIHTRALEPDVPHGPDYYHPDPDTLDAEPVDPDPSGLPGGVYTYNDKGEIVPYEMPNRPDWHTRPEPTPGKASTNPSTNPSIKDDAAGGTEMDHQQAAAFLHQSADKIDGYRQALHALGQDLEATKWGPEVHAPLQEMHNLFAAAAECYRGLAEQVRNEGDNVGDAIDAAPWVPDEAVMS